MAETKRRLTINLNGYNSLTLPDPRPSIILVAKNSFNSQTTFSLVGLAADNPYVGIRHGESRTLARVGIKGGIGREDFNGASCKLIGTNSGGLRQV